MALGGNREWHADGSLQGFAEHEPVELILRKSWRGKWP